MIEKQDLEVRTPDVYARLINRLSLEKAKVRLGLDRSQHGFKSQVCTQKTINRGDIVIFRPTPPRMSLGRFWYFRQMRKKYHQQACNHELRNRQPRKMG